MKAIFFLFFLLLSPLYALYNGNPSAPNLIDEPLFSCEEDLFILKAGYQGDFVLNRKLQADHGATGRMDEAQLSMNQGVLTLNMQDRFELYGSVGAMNAFLSHYSRHDYQRREYQTHDNLAWGAGARFVIVPFEHIDLGIEGGYQKARNHLSWITLDGVPIESRGLFLYQEWQVGIGLSYHVDFFTPYLAVKYSNVNAKFTHLGSNLLIGNGFKMHSREHYGLALGCTLSNGRIFDLTAEVRLFDEQAATLAGNIKF